MLARFTFAQLYVVNVLTLAAYCLSPSQEYSIGYVAADRGGSVPSVIGMISGGLLS